MFWTCGCSTEHGIDFFADFGIRLGVLEEVVHDECEHPYSTVVRAILVYVRTVAWDVPEVVSCPATRKVNNCEQ